MGKVENRYFYLSCVNIYFNENSNLKNLILIQKLPSNTFLPYFLLRLKETYISDFFLNLNKPERQKMEPFSEHHNFLKT